VAHRRAEDIFVNTILGARTQLFDDDGWAKRLAVTRATSASGWPAPRSPS